MGGVDAAWATHVPGEHTEVEREPEADTTHPISARRHAGSENAVKFVLLAAILTE